MNMRKTCLMCAISTILKSAFAPDTLICRSSTLRSPDLIPQPSHYRPQALTQDPANRVYLISGRPRSEVGTWFEELPQLGLACEHGFFFKCVTAPFALLLVLPWPKGCAIALASMS